MRDRRLTQATRVEDTPECRVGFPILKRFTIAKEMLHEQDYSPWEGHEVHAWPVLTVMRGKVAVEHGKFTADLSDGQYLFREISEEIRGGAAP
jgi:dihydropyrimidinase